MNNNDLLKYINEFFTSFEKDYTFYINGERIKFCKATDTRVIWQMVDDWNFLAKREIKEVSIMATSLTITTMSARKYTFIAKPKLKEEITEKIVSLLKIKLSRIFYEAGIKEEINGIIYLLDELERINKE
jgi:hypothetical protein